MNRIQKLLLGVVAITAMAGPALAETPELPPCKTGSKAVTLVFRTDTTSGWTVNGAPVSAVGNPGWVNVSPATWIGPAGGKGPASLVYSITFDAPMMHGPMTVKARWAADNCGASMRAGTGPVVTIPGNSCPMAASPNGRDFLSFTRTTTANFHPNDSSDPTPTITFTVSNQNGTATGFAGEFTVTALCVCRG